MPGSSNFLQWNPTAANQETDSAYSSDALRTGGAANPSILPSVTANKLFFQVTTFIAAFAQMMSGKGYTVSDANLSTLAGVLTAIMTQADMAPYAPLASPALSGHPTAPTAPANDNTLQIACTNWVQGFTYARAVIDAALALKAPVTNPVFSGTVNITGSAIIPGPPAGDNSTRVPNTNWVTALFAPLASPHLTGTPTTPTPPSNDSTGQIPNTFWVREQNYQPALGFTPVQQGGGNAQSGNKIYIGWDGTHLRAQVDTIDIGELASTSDFLAYTPLSSFGLRSLTANGYQVFPGGLVLQWGAASVPQNGSTTFFFNVPFASACFSIVVTKGSVISASNAGYVGADTLNNSQFQLTNTANSGGPQNVHWFAVGV